MNIFKELDWSYNSESKIYDTVAFIDFEFIVLIIFFDNDNWHLHASNTDISERIDSGTCPDELKQMAQMNNNNSVSTAFLTNLPTE